MGPDLRILVDGDSTRVYYRGDKITGRVVLGNESGEDIKTLRLSFSGTCTTTTTRPIHRPLYNNTDLNAEIYRERVQLFRFEKDLLADCQLPPNKDSWTFEFTFPELTEPKFSRWQHGLKYLKKPHSLPPSFYTRTPGGRAAISYSLKAKLCRHRTKDALVAQEPLYYHPTPENVRIEPKICSRVLYAQIWKPLSENRKSIDKALSKLSHRSSANNNGPRIVPTLHFPEMIAPGQNIPLYISLENTQPIDQRQLAQCMIDSVIVKISTHTTSMCGQSAAEPEDTMVKHVNCLTKTNMAKPIPFDTRVKLADNFRLVDNAECVPSFKTYTITRRYDLVVAVGLKYEGRDFTIRCTTLLDIQPRIPRELLPNMLEDEEDDFDPLPPYEPREASREFAPQYESLYESGRSSPSEASLANTDSRGSSMFNFRTHTPEPEGMSSGEPATRT